MNNLVPIRLEKREMWPRNWKNLNINHVLMMPLIRVSKRKNRKLLKMQIEEWLKYMQEKPRRLIRLHKILKRQRVLVINLLRKQRKKNLMLLIK